MRNTRIAQPAIGAISLAMLKILQKFNVFPHATCGHSFGELTALCAAGWIAENSLLELAVARGKCMASAAENSGHPNGAMLAVTAPLADLENLVAPQLGLCEMTSQTELKQLLHRMLGKLKARERKAIEMWMEGMSNRAIANQLKTTVGAVKMLEYRTILKLRRMLEDYSEED